MKVFCAILASPYIDTIQNTVLCLLISSDQYSFPLALTTDYYKLILVNIINEFKEDSVTSKFYNEISSYLYFNWNTIYFDHNVNITIDSGICFCVENSYNQKATSCIKKNKSIIIIPIESTARRKLF
jgi:MinD-like ATPase involved in chromosome partitioning or flagellar assembly